MPTLPKIIQKEYEQRAYQMFSSSHEAQIREYKKYLGKDGNTWLVSTCDDPASHIYVSDKNPKSQGFGGREISFKIEGEKEILKLQGPWHTNANALFNAAGIDLKNLIMNWGLIALHRINRKGKSFDSHYTVFTDILYIDGDKPVASNSGRIHNMAVDMANKYNIIVMAYSETKGGSCSGSVKPGDKYYE